ncbi:helix-turn-helix transcriptional regulator [Pseudomonas sp.]|uniref:helix-turn-helix domain-containing protein n=1 Tax=Pseudomonas sp. TaxID=306 RepID=UPI00260FCDCF|nr:helix-turn-helix transcriptional regulator [Pseudomonas sp.]
MPISSSTLANALPSARAVLAANVLRLRNEKNWSQEMLGFETGLHRTFIAHVERQARNISIDNMEKIAKALGVATFRLLEPQQ